MTDDTFTPAQAVGMTEALAKAMEIVEMAASDDYAPVYVSACAKKLMYRLEPWPAAQPPAATVETKSAPGSSAPHNTGERPPSSNAADTGADTRSAGNGGAPGNADMLELSKRIENGLKNDNGDFFAPPLSRKQWRMIASSLDYAARFDMPAQPQAAQVSVGNEDEILVRQLRQIATEFAIDNKTDCKQHVCWIAADRLATQTASEPVAETGTVHKLKTWPEYFNEVLRGRKPFEWRVDDRDFKLGDTLVLQEYIPHPENPGREGKYTGREITKTVSYIFSPWPTNKRTVVMGLALSRPESK